MKKKKYNYTIYSDASYDSDLKIAAASYIIIDHQNGEMSQETRLLENVDGSCQAELLGILSAVEKLPQSCGPYHVICDCESLIKTLNSIKDTKFVINEKTESLNLSKEDLKNFKKTRCKNISFSWQRGHSGELLNSLVDVSSRKILRQNRDLILAGSSSEMSRKREIASQLSSMFNVEEEPTVYA